MKFSDAMKALEEGKEVRCIRWPSKDKCSHGNLYTALVSHEPIDYALEWEIYQEPEKTYTFMEVVEGLKDRQKFKRLCWHYANIDYIECIEEDIRAFSGNYYHLYSLSLSDILSKDWIRVH